MAVEYHQPVEKVVESLSALHPFAVEDRIGNPSVIVPFIFFPDGL